MTHHIGIFDVAISGAAILTVLLLSVVLERAGLAQPLALAIALPCSLLVLYPAIRRWMRAAIPFHKWAMTTVFIALAGLLLELVVGRL